MALLPAMVGVKVLPARPMSTALIPPWPRIAAKTEDHAQCRRLPLLGRGDRVIASGAAPPLNDQLGCCSTTRRQLLLDALFVDHRPDFGDGAIGEGVDGVFGKSHPSPIHVQTEKFTLRGAVKYYASR